MNSKVFAPTDSPIGPIYVLEGDRQFHNELKCWEAALGVTDILHDFAKHLNEDDPEWLAWWNASTDPRVRPEVHRPVPVAPEFEAMTKTQLVEWLNSNRVQGEGVVRPRDLNRGDLIALAEERFGGGPNREPVNAK